ncbi:predicted protein [Histoplasma capsulatum var. duboisii H88]|uniref:Predicted protein n=1 Tax=Ajellomyces capsulatus (strain H88) TaxID=544711 RepID=F0UH23_AJEC8|nr:predicted protein [Histoplasma capsulatum var. duboisii H88]
MPTWLQVGMLDVVEEMQELEVTEEDQRLDGKPPIAARAGSRTPDSFGCVSVSVSVTMARNEGLHKIAHNYGACYWFDRSPSQHWSRAASLEISLPISKRPCDARNSELHPRHKIYQPSAPGGGHLVLLAQVCHFSILENLTGVST